MLRVRGPLDWSARSRSPGHFAASISGCPPDASPLAILSRPRQQLGTRSVAPSAWESLRGRRGPLHAVVDVAAGLCDSRDRRCRGSSAGPCGVRPPPPAFCAGGLAVTPSPAPPVWPVCCFVCGLWSPSTLCIRTGAMVRCGAVMPAYTCVDDFG